MSTARTAYIHQVTNKDVAKAAGVSSATVSYNLGKVTPEVDRHVRQVANDRGYSRNSIATALKTGRRNVIGCIFPTLASPVFPEILQAVQRQAELKGFATFPADISVIGFDNIQWTSWPLIDLTTIH